MAKRPKASEDWNDPENSGGNAPDEDAAADLAARSDVDHDAPDGAGPALSERQLVGLDPVDAEKHAEQAADRTELTNAQTDHEAAGGLDPVSGTPNTGVTENVSHSASGVRGASDMSGNLPYPDPLDGLDAATKGVMEKLQKASSEAKGKGEGYVSLKELGVSKTAMDVLVKDGKVTQETRPGGTFAPETGTVYRVASHQD